MVEASCLEWAAVAAVVLRDAMAIIRIVNAARSAPDAVPVVQRLYEGFIQLDNYAQHTCLGYRPFMTSIQPQVRSLAKFISAASPTTSPPLMGSYNGPLSGTGKVRVSPVPAASSPPLRPALPRSLSDPLGVRLGATPPPRELPTSASLYHEQENHVDTVAEEQPQSSCSIS
jgi:hypothetical protein